MGPAARKKYLRSVELELPRRCALNPSVCALRHDKVRRGLPGRKIPYAFIMRPYDAEFLDTETSSKRLLGSIGSVAFQASDIAFVGAGFCQICELSAYSHFGISEITKLNPNVMLETGLMLAMSKPVIMTLDTSKTPIDKIPFDYKAMLIVPYRNRQELVRGLKSRIDIVVDELKKRKLL